MSVKPEENLQLLASAQIGVAVANRLPTLTSPSATSVPPRWRQPRSSRPAWAFGQSGRERAACPLFQGGP